MLGLRYNLNLIKKVLNKQGLRVPTIIFNNSISYTFKQMYRLNHDLPKYSSRALLMVTFSQSTGTINITYLTVGANYVNEYMLKWPKYYGLSDLFHHRINSGYAEQRGEWEFKKVTIESNCKVYDVIERVNTALDDFFKSWTAMLDVFRSPAYKAYQEKLKERRTEVSKIRNAYKAQLDGCVNIMQNQFSINMD